MGNVLSRSHIWRFHFVFSWPVLTVAGFILLLPVSGCGQQLPAADSTQPPVAVSVEPATSTDPSPPELEEAKEAEIAQDQEALRLRWMQLIEKFTSTDEPIVLLDHLIELRAKEAEKAEQQVDGKSHETVKDVVSPDGFIAQISRILKTPLPETNDDIPDNYFEYGKIARGHLEKRDFADFENLIADLEDRNVRTHRGASMVVGVLNYVIYPDQREIIDEWTETRPDSWLPWVCKALIHESIGWQARGSGFANSVSEDAWKVFHENIGEAWTALDKSLDLKPNNLPALTYQIRLAKTMGVPIPEMFALYKRALEEDNDAWFCRLFLLDALYPKWGGSVELTEQFVRVELSRATAAPTEMLLLKMHDQMTCLVSDKQAYFTPEIIDEIVKAGDRLVGRYPKSAHFPSEFARVLEKSGNIEDSRRFHLMALALNHNHFWDVASYLRWNERNTLAEIAAYDALIEAYPEVYRGYRDRAKACLRLRQNSLAQEDIVIAHELAKKYDLVNSDEHIEFLNYAIRAHHGQVKISQELACLTLRREKYAGEEEWPLVEWIDQAWLLIRDGRYQEACDIIDPLVEKYPQIPDLYLIRSYCMEAFRKQYLAKADRDRYSELFREGAQWESKIIHIVVKPE
ncbi:DUF4034 domain-containing protein [Calycomorphotria hydatis]|uniref:DUF4034 domain-containing protein n=1 Tax=Calycomorphotria hydatis TaxID=2528027 RepID=A0A517TET2_9PLAN|nr:DUF4034 domain-containing protein [Calycomorphotria hydatis]QDT66877.1 hypothetical protein V22_41490 [Calycomorphotria hydatis]